MTFDELFGTTRGSHPQDATALLEHMQDWPRRFADFARALVGFNRFELAVTRLVERDGVLAAEQKLWTIASGYDDDLTRLRLADQAVRDLLVPLVEGVDAGPQLRPVDS